MAEGEGQAIERVFAAIHNGDPSDDLIAIRYLDALQGIANGTATKIFLPMEASGILGSIGANFGAGMTGGMAYLYDPEGESERLMNMETLVTCPVTVDHWKDELRGLVQRHAAETGSRKAADLLQHCCSP